MISESEVISELKDILSDLYCKYGTDTEIVKLSQLLDKLLVSKQRESFRLINTERRIRNIIEATNDIMFEVDITNNKLLSKTDGLIDNIIVGNKQKDLYSFILKNYIENIIYKDDLKAFKEKFSLNNIVTRNLEKEEDLSLECRLLVLGEYKWFSYQVASYYSEENKSFIAISYAKDINDKKIKELEYIRKSERDPLTGIYNKIKSQELIERYISKHGTNKKSALFIVDIDNFKNINDRLGHIFGDAVLVDISNELNSMFRDTDIVGRIGGDEFIILIKDIQSEEILIRKAEEILSIFRNSFVGENSKKHKVSGSIGISQYPKDGNSFEDLYIKADEALYNSKEIGKDCYSIYDKDRSYVSNGRQTDNNILELEQNIKSINKFNENIFENIFKILYNSKDISTAISLIIKLVGIKFNLNRVYIKERDYSNEDLRCNFEWVNRDMHSNSSNDYTLKIDIIENDINRGHIGFELNNEENILSDSDIDTLSLISNVISTFMLKKYSHDKIIDAYHITKAVMDKIECYAYVIDKDSHEILYINDKLKYLDQNINIGDICYKSFFNNKNSSCEACPINGLRKYKEDEYSMEIYLDKYDIWFNAVASNIKWIDSKNACLILSYDITKYKNK
ncbi:GGDEF domain-containing protein [Romboutsia weinsteinii]|uniref:GGDEF domain-containing protein n=1 Tax=Romboutsia weinsteinii TaxID=2020949 RepID=A0A371J1B8_9FIRM|nr:GGDEF domain-containing protein [Romboutsia weinsteinii]RDY26456.1 GGDEF domain-containing protein [Romboutsia weinsteinii]